MGWYSGRGLLDENRVRHPSCVGLGDEAVDEQGGEAMNQAASRHSRRIVFARLLVGADRNALKQTEDRALGLIQLRVFRVSVRKVCESFESVTEAGLIGRNHV